jgi:hypothetical protein
MDIVIIVVFFASVALAVGYYLGFRAAHAAVINELTDMVLENIVDLTHEVVEQQHYIYYKDTGEFAAQGSTLDEAVKNFSVRDSCIGRLETSLGKFVFIVDGKMETQ